MKWRIEQLRKRKRGRISKRIFAREGDRLRIGRSPESELHLLDNRVRLRHAELLALREGVLVRAVDAATLRVDDALRKEAELQVGSVVKIGPYDLTLLEPQEPGTRALSVLLARPLGDDLDQLRARSRTTLSQAGVNMTALSYAAGLTSLLLLLVAPLLAYALWPESDPMGVRSSAVGMWNSGELASAHSYFGADCAACHDQAFEAAPDARCLECHDEGAHAKKEPEALQRRCGDCHEEHTGPKMTTLADQSFCADCHEDGGEDMQPASDFGKEHPEFAALGKTDPGNLSFSHKAHLQEELPGPEGAVALACGDCHQADDQGVGMQPVRYQAHCADCHVLAFESWAPERRLPHGDVALVTGLLEDFYRSAAGSLPQDASLRVQRRRPGAAVEPSAQEDPEAWIEARSAEGLSLAFGRTACGLCHWVGEDGDRWSVQPLNLNDNWMGGVTLSHATHDVLPCEDCHAAGDSERHEDVLMPALATCQTCHQGEDSRDGMSSSCDDCHDFHRHPAVK